MPQEELFSQWDMMMWKVGDTEYRSGMQSEYVGI